MNFIYFAPHFPDNYQNFSIRLSEIGVTTLGIGDCPYDQLSGELKQALREYYFLPRMDDYNEVLRAVGFLTYKYGKIDRFESMNEHWLVMDARIRTDFNIPGVKSGEIGPMKLKSEMKRLFQSVGVETARGEVIGDIMTAREFVARVGYPIIAKPDSGVGALSTCKIGSDPELEDFFAHPPHVPYIFEEFIKGDIFSFDGLTDQNGEIVFYTSHAFGDGIMETVNDDKHLYYYSLQHIPDDLEKAGRRIIKAYQLKERFFHLEFFRTDTGRLVALEANLRPPGGFTTDMFNYANDIDIYHEWAQVVANNTFTATYDRRYICAYIGRKINKSYRYSDEQIHHELHDLIVQHSDISGVFSSALGNTCYIVRSQSMDQIRHAIKMIHQMV
ncbi:MAG: ATP-grasp domain-containing protein [bacterium]